VLTPLYKSGKAKKVADQSVPDWDNQQALTIFEQMLQKTSNKIDGVLAANDGLGNSVVSALKSRKLGQKPVTGQDATPEGIQNILAGDQCMTVYKAVKKEADAASKLAIALSKGEKPPAGLVNAKSDDTARQVPSVLLQPQPITKANAKVVFDDGFLKRSEVCTGKFESLCKEAGI
jgi:D-xylose transport system substrate-binding protein